MYESLDVFDEIDIAAECPEEYRRHNAEMNLAWRFIANTGVSVFLTGKAGTGKTTFLHRLRELMPKRMVVLAPTGVAAINAGGQTIHSFFQLPFGPFIPGMTGRDSSAGYRMSPLKKNLIRSLDLLVIDEISMVRADLLDAVDEAMRKYRDGSKPFGGVQLLLIGDLMQLAPVAQDREWHLLSDRYDTPYFFSSHALRQLQYVTVELRHIYRQQDAEFINLLAAVRSGNITQEVADALNRRYIPDFKDDGEGWIRLTTHNATARSYNDSRLAQLPSPAYTFAAEIKGDFPESNFPADQNLTLKEGAQVMFIKNDPSPTHSYFNGKIGKITAFTPAGILVECPGDENEILVEPVVWENMKYTLNPETKEISEEVVGLFKQYPLRTAWAITVHKSQGLTFDRAVLDVNASFAHGQTYVALSRCRTLEGMVLSSPINLRSVITDNSVNSFIDKELGALEQNVAQLPRRTYEYTLSLLDELYSFRAVEDAYRWLIRVVDEHLASRLPNLLATLKAAAPTISNETSVVAAKFRNFYAPTLAQQNCKIAGTPLEERIKKSADYFLGKLTELFSPILDKLAVHIENKQTAETYNRAVGTLIQAIKIKARILKPLCDTSFTISNYLQIKAKAVIEVADDNTGDPFSDRQSKGKKAAKAARATKVAKEAASKVAGDPLPAPTAKGKKAPKEPKPDTKEVTYNLYLQGLTPAEIAAKRGLAESTIYSHLTHYVTIGVLPLADFVDERKQVIIATAIDSFSTAYTIGQIKEIVPEDVMYHHIKMYLSHLNG